MSKLATFLMIEIFVMGKIDVRISTNLIWLSSLCWIDGAKQPLARRLHLRGEDDNAFVFVCYDDTLHALSG